MNKLVRMVMALSVSLSTLAFATEDFIENDFYVKGFAGADFLQTEIHSGIKPYFDVGYIVSGALGYQWCEFQVEAEYAFRRNGLSTLHYFGQNFNIPGHYQSSSYMANLYWDFPFFDCITYYLQPYLGGGIGYDVQQFHANQDGFRFDEDKKGFAWQLMTGFRYALFSCSDISLEYKFHKGPLKNIYSHAIGVSINYKFSFCGYADYSN